jgi:hypothetical protein
MLLLHSDDLLCLQLHTIGSQICRTLKVSVWPTLIFDDIWKTKHFSWYSPTFGPCHTRTSGSKTTPISLCHSQSWIYLAKIKPFPCLFKNHAITHVWGIGFIVRCIVNKSTNWR